MNKQISFLTTIFPTKKEYIYDFFDSLSKQTYKDFDIVVINDGYKNFDIIKRKYNNLNIIELKYSNKPAKNREYGINWCIDNSYDVLIFGDSDDYFSRNRIELSLEKLKDFNIIVNDLSLFDESGVYIEKYISNRIKDGAIINHDFIKDKNIFGLSNTAINIKILNKVVFESDIVAVDWFFYKSLLAKGHKAIFTNKMETYYRQYENNTIGLDTKANKYPLWWEKLNKDDDEG